MSELFRRQAIDYQRQKFHGAIVITRSPWEAAVAAFFVLLVLALLVFAATQGFSRKESVAGVLTPAGGVLRLVAPQAGTVVAVPAAQGSRVAAGQVVVQLSTEQSSATGPTQEAVARSLASRAGSLGDEMRQQGQQARQQAALLDARVSAAEAELGKHDREISLQRERLELVRDVAARYAELVRSGAVSPVEVSEKQAELWVPTSAGAFVHAGTPVSLRVDAFPYARYGQLPAHVREVSQSAVAIADLGDPSAEVPGPSRQSVFRVMVVLDAGSTPDWRPALKAGMRVQASLVAEHRTLLQWALEPLNALRAASR